MDVVLISLAILSIAAAVGFGAVAWRTLDGERRRSAARVAALSSAIDASHDTAAPAHPPVPVAVSSMFRTAPGASVGGRPLIKAAVVATMGIALIVVVAMASRDRGEAAAPQAATVAASAPLELVSMRHTREGSTLTVSGLVRNPAAGMPVARIAAVVFTFDRDGSFLASARAPLDFTTLEPGDESPFVVTIPNVGDVGRYRVSFRTEAGVVRHVDRRTQSQLAMHQ